ncbi:Thioredoxin family protein [Euphorbia peplus]|nr:Thioredoxin family protein [Euphorbia peplus]
MAGVLNIPRPTTLRPTPSNRKLSKRPISVVKASSETPISNLEATFSAPPNFKPPTPQPFAVKSGKALDVLGAALALFFRFGTGVFVNGYSASFVPKDEFPPDQYALSVGGYKVKETSKVGARPEKPIEIYEFEGCPFCRKVREIVAVLDIDVLFYPCPVRGPTFRPKAIQMGGKKQFPYMVDPNTGTAMYESDDIIKYLVDKYGDGTVPLALSLGLLTTLTAGFAMLGRAGKGSSYTPSRIPPKPLEIWSYEGSPFCKLVREALVELELPHIQRSCARGSSKRQALFEKAGHFQVPYLEDPNTGIQMFESADIVDYLRATYALQ